MNAFELNYLLKDVLQTETLLYMERHSSFSWKEFEDFWQFTEELSKNPPEGGDPLESAKIVGRKVRLPAVQKAYWELFKNSDYHANLWSAGKRAYPLSVVFIGIQRLMGFLPLPAWIFGEMNLAAQALDSLRPSEENNERIDALTQGKCGAFLSLSAAKSGHISKIAEEGTETHQVQGGLSEYPAGHHDLFQNGFYLHLATHESASEGYFQTVSFDEKNENGLHTLGMLNPDGGDFYTAHVLFGHEEECMAEKAGTVRFGGKPFQRLGYLVSLNAANLSLGAAKLAYGAAHKAFFRNLAEGPPFICSEADKLMHMRCLLASFETCLYSACLYFDLTGGDLKSEKEHFERLAKIHCTLLGSYFLEEAMRVFTLAEQMMEEFHGLNYGDFSTLRAILRSARSHNLKLSENHREAVRLLMEEKKERCLEALLREMEETQSKMGEHSLTNESLVHWRDAVASLILLVEHLGKTDPAEEEDEILLQTGSIVRCLGRVIGGYFLLKTATHAEEKLAEMGYDFGRQGSETEPETEEEKFYLEKILEAEYYCLNLLGEVDPLQKSVYRNSLSPLMALGG